MKQYFVEKIDVRILENKNRMGAAAAAFVADKIKSAIEERGAAHIIVATGASQFGFLDALTKEQSIEWRKVTAFHLDEYKDMSSDHPASFRKYLNERFFNIVKPGRVHLLNGDASDINAEVERYERLLLKHHIDVACIGIGENGHLAFNDPPVADFDDPHLVKVVELDEACRRQQLGEGWFPTFEDVPRHALSLTIPAIMRARTISCVVPDARKAQAVHDALYGEISTVCPASVLRRHENTVLWLDEPASSLIVK